MLSGEITLINNHYYYYYQLIAELCIHVCAYMLRCVCGWVRGFAEH